jgi:homoserine dehydrogenase
VQLRFEASVCAAIPVIKVLRESLVVTNVHRVLGIVNGTTNFVLTEMEAGKTYEEALAMLRSAATPRRIRPTTSRAPMPPRRWRSSRPVAFNSRVALADVDYDGITTVDAATSPRRATSTW